MYDDHLLACTLARLSLSYGHQHILVGKGCCNGTALVLYIHEQDYDIPIPVKWSHGAAS